MSQQYQHDYFSMDIDEALSHTAANLNAVHQEVKGWSIHEDDYSWRIQDWLLELTEAMSFLGALTKLQKQNTLSLEARVYQLEQEKGDH